MFFTTFALAVMAQGAATRPGAFVPFSTKGDLAIVQDPSGNGDTRIYYQPSSGTITEYSVSGPFDVGRTVGTGPLSIVPATQALQGTPIEAVVLGPGYTEESRASYSTMLVGLTSFIQQVHFFFLSPTRVLSEYFWSSATSWRGGSACPQCVTNLGIQVSSANNALSATIDTVHNVIAVTFIDARNNGTLSEAVRRNGAWVVAPLPDY
ncbi:hypothetical protein H0H87_002692 [Tephrocybe sp. NHM501043]|nr:hypothetical protein H0H87_002692 [Tephrocybe sp. NHM501043]